jgi:membrane dipeptidase
MNRVGVIVDVAHSGWQTSHEAAKASSRPMVASHTVCGELSGHRRGKPENVVRAIVETGGYIGICTITSFLGRSGDIVALLDHIDHVARRFGADHVAIGTDRAHSIRAGREEEPPMSRPPKRKRFENFWHADDPMYDPVWQTPEKVKSMGWTNWPLFTVGLVQRGYSDDDIRKIIGLNVLRVARAALG